METLVSHLIKNLKLSMKRFRIMEESFKKLIQDSEGLVHVKNFAGAQAKYEEWIKSCKASVCNEEKTRYERIMAEAHNNLGQIKYLQVEFDDAVKEYDQALSFNPEFASAYYNRGTIKYRMGKFHLAAEDMQKAVSLDSDNSEFKLGLHRTLQEMSKT